MSSLSSIGNVATTFPKIPTIFSEEHDEITLGKEKGIILEPSQANFKDLYLTEKQSHENLKEKFDRVCASITKFESHILNLEEKIEEMNRDNHNERLRQKKINSEVHLKNEELEKRIKTISARNVELSKEVEEARKEVTKARDTNVIHERTIKTLSTKNLELSKEVEEARKEVTKARDTNVIHERSIKTLSTKNLEISKELENDQGIKKIQEENIRVLNMALLEKDVELRNAKEEIKRSIAATELSAKQLNHFHYSELLLKIALNEKDAALEAGRKAEEKNKALEAQNKEQLKTLHAELYGMRREEVPTEVNIELIQMQIRNLKNTVGKFEVKLKESRRLDPANISLEGLPEALDNLVKDDEENIKINQELNRIVRSLEDTIEKKDQLIGALQTHIVSSI